MQYMQAFLGIAILTCFFFVVSEAKKRVAWKTVVIGIGLQFALAAVLLHTPIVRDALLAISSAVVVLQDVTNQATAFLFGYLAGGPPPFDVTAGENQTFIAFAVFPLLLVIGALSAVLFHWGVLPWIIRLLSKGLTRTLGLKGPLSFGASAAVFLGTIEAPMVVKPYLSRMSRSDLFALISASMATVAGTVMVLYASVLGGALPNALGHIIVASVISVPAALIFARMWIPPGQDEQRDEEEVLVETPYSSTFGALIQGTKDAAQMIIDIVAVILVLFALVYLTDRGLGLIHEGTTLISLAGYPLRPILWLTGIDWAETGTAGELMATKVILNEFVAYLNLATVDVADLSERSRTILTYCLCGFGNFGSAGIIVAGLSGMVPERKELIASLVLRGLVVGNAATLMTGIVVGCML